MSIAVRAERVRSLGKSAPVAARRGGISYWMQRDCRVQDNWALLYAAQLAQQKQVPLSVCYCIGAGAMSEPATLRSSGFLLGGLQEVERDLRSLSIPLVLLQGAAAAEVPAFARRHELSAVVSDFSPLRQPREWKQAVADALPEGTPFFEVDAHNIVPCWVASPKLEVGARTIRSKITTQLPSWLKEMPQLTPEALASLGAPPASLAAESSAQKPIDWKALKEELPVDRAVPEVEWCEPGTAAALAAVARFTGSRLRHFADRRNDPNEQVCSDLSPYLHTGQLGAQRMALLVKQANSSSTSDGVKAFLEESIVRRELSDNFCFYQPQYDSLQGAAGWARDSLALHSADAREHVYSEAQFEAGQTHEDLWNAAQRQLVSTGKMHGFMRMYWAKKILEWSASPEEALRIALHLNDKYSLDGCDPNGYVGCAWSIMGTHDMGWAERAVFGKIRYMNYNGCKRKFDTAAYVAKWGTGGGKGGKQATLFAGPGEPAKKKAKK